MPKKQIKSKTKLSDKDRLIDARKWLRTPNCPQKKLLQSYIKRYRVSETIAFCELSKLGYRDELLIAQFEKNNIEWKYMVEPLSGEMILVPEETEEHELY